jgi:hypothetical protein
VLKVDGFLGRRVGQGRGHRAPADVSPLGQPNQDFRSTSTNGAVRMLVEGEPGRYGFAAAKPPRPEVWTHYLGTYDGKTAKIYRDGVLEGQQAVPLKRTAFVHPLTVGVIDGLEERMLKGSMTDIRIWNRALDAAEARHLAARGVAGSGARADRALADPTDRHDDREIG